MNDCSALLEIFEKDDFCGWEEAVQEVVNKYGCRLMEKLFEMIDSYLAKNRQKDLRMIGYKEKMLISKYGQINLKRRYYRDTLGNYRFLLDEALGLEKRRATTPQIASYAAALAAYVPFRVAEDLILRAFGVKLSHQSIHNLTSRFGQAEIEKEAAERLNLFELGQLPKSKEKEAEELFLEADGVNISLQQEKIKKCEVKVGVVYSDKKDGRTVDKVIHLDLADGNTFWQGLTVKTAKVFNLAKLSKTTIGGDGAAFVRIGQRLFKDARFRLDPFHVAKAIKGVLGWTKNSYQATKEALAGNLSTATAILDKAKASSIDNNKRSKIQKVKRYLKNNADGLGEGPSLGTIETNVDKLAANRMKKRGMSWTKAGARRMLKLLEKRAYGSFDNILTLREPTTVEVQKKLIIESLHNEPQEWLGAHVAAFSGPNSSKPWVKLLREVVRGEELKLVEFVPTKT